MIRVLEIGAYAAPEAGRMLVGLGADVVVVEPAGGSAARGTDPAGFAHRTAGKSSAYPADAAVLAGEADVILDGTYGGGLVPLAAELAAAAPRGAAHVVLTPYGDRGDTARWAATDLTVAAAGGMLALVGEPDRPPLRPYGDQADQLAGVNAAIAALLATRTGGGRVVVSGQASVAASLEFGAITYIHTGRPAERTGGTHPIAPHTLFPAADGMLAGGLGGNPRMWDDLVGWLTESGIVGDLADGRLRDSAYREEHRQEIFDRLADIVRGVKRDEFFHEGQARRLPWAAVLRPEELADNAQLVERGFFVDVTASTGTARDVGFAARVEGAEPAGEPRVPSPGEHTAWRPAGPGALSGPGASSAGRLDRSVAFRGPRGRPLDGVRVLDLTWVLAGPYGTGILAEHGAEVIKVESRHRPDPTRFAEGFHVSRDATLDPNTSGYFNNVNRNKKSLTLNLRRPEAREVTLRLARDCDVVVENFAAGVLDRLGLGYETLREVREDIIVVSMSGMGHTGPWRGYVSYADAVSALSGWTALTGEPGRPPVGVVFGLADILAGYHAALATLTALTVRERTGRGQHVDLAQLEVAASHLGDALLRSTLAGETVRPLGSRHPRMAPHGVFPCLGDDTWVAVAVRTDEEFARLAAVVGPDAGRAPVATATLADRTAHEDELEAWLAGWTRPRPAETVAAELQRHGIPAYPVRDGRTLVEHDTALRAWGFYEPVTHPAVGTFPHEGSPIRLPGPPREPSGPAPLLGEHTERVLTDLGLTVAEIATLRAADALE